MESDLTPPVLELDTCLVRDGEVLTSEIEDELILLDAGRDKYYGMNPVGRHIWDLLAVPRSVGDVCEDVATHFEVDAGNCAPEVLAFAGMLIGAGLARIVDAPSGPG